MITDALSSSVAELLDATASSSPDAVALVCDDEPISFADLRSRARALAAGLRRQGVRPGEHIGVWMHNSIDFVVVVYAAAYAHALLVPMNTWHRAREMGYAVRQSEITTLLVGDTVAGRDGRDAVRELMPDASSSFPQLRTLIFAGEPLKGGYRLADLTDAVNDCANEPVRDTTAPSYMLYTSGTTGDAKGVLLDDAGVTADARHLGRRLGLRSGDAYYCPVPLFHAGGLIFVLLAAHAVGASVITRARFDADEALDDIDHHDCGVTGGFEVIYSRLVEAAEARGLGSTRLRSGWWVGTAGAFLRTERALGLRLSNFYGMTEASGNVASTPLEWSKEERAHHQGTPLPGRIIEVVDTITGAALPADGVGEIRVSGWGLMHGYWNKPEATAAKVDGQGRLRSGDLGMIDGAGNVHFLGRSDDAVKIGGENVTPLEVEEVLAEHDDVDEVVVVGIPHERYGQQLVALVRPRADAATDADALQRFVRERLAAFKVPRRIEFVDDFPRTSTGKVRKSEITARLVEPSATTTSSKRQEESS